MLFSTHLVYMAYIIGILCVEYVAHSIYNTLIEDAFDFVLGILSLLQGSISLLQGSIYGGPFPGVHFLTPGVPF